MRDIVIGQWSVVSAEVALLAESNVNERTALPHEKSVVPTGLSRTNALASIPTFPFVMQEKRRALRFGASADGHPSPRHALSSG
jgi:hypothetical protein